MIPHISRFMNRTSHFPTLAAFAIALSFALAGALAVAQTPPREKPKLKDFGSSVRKLRWDPELNATVETNSADGRTKKSEDDDVVRIETSLVVCDVSVLDRQGHPVQGLRPDDFVVTEDDKPQQVGSFALGDNSNIARSIVLLIDYSASQLPFINTSIAAAKTLVDKLNPLDRMAIVTDDVELLLDFTSDKRKLKDNLELLRKRATAKPNLLGFGGKRRFGLSAQYSAFMATLKEAFNNEDQRPILIFQTDGDEVMFLRNPIVGPFIPANLSPDRQEQAVAAAARTRQIQLENMRQFSLEDVYKAAEKSRATVYTVIPGFRLVGLSADQQEEQLRIASEQRRSAWSVFGGKSAEQIRKIEADRWNNLPPDQLKYEVETAVKIQTALAEVAPLTGGWTSFLEQPTQADEIYSRIFSDINRRYVVGYYPTNKARDGRRRKVNVEVRGHPDYTVLGRKSYFAAGPEQ
jgi:VWFA-related protein